MAHFDGAVTVHEPTPQCQPWHCHSHNLDEDYKTFIVCFECGHGYRSGWALKRAFIRTGWDLARTAMTPLARSTRFYPSLVRILWKSVTIRAKNITFCQECSHDF